MQQSVVRSDRRCILEQDKRKKLSSESSSRDRACSARADTARRGETSGEGGVAVCADLQSSGIAQLARGSRGQRR